MLRTTSKAHASISLWNIILLLFYTFQFNFTYKSKAYHKFYSGSHYNIHCQPKLMDLQLNRTEKHILFVLFFKKSSFFRRFSWKNICNHAFTRKFYKILCLYLFWINILIVFFNPLEKFFDFKLFIMNHGTIYSLYRIEKKNSMIVYFSR